MSTLIRVLRRLQDQSSGGVSLPGDDRYAAATATWARPVGRMPRAVAHCLTASDVQSAIRAARDADLSLSVRGGGHDWALRALCDGLVIDLHGMSDVAVDARARTARVSGGARASDVAAATDRAGVIPVVGVAGPVGVAGFTLGGGYGPVIGRFGLALDNLLAADVVLADGRLVAAAHEREPELLWALRGGGGNFGVVTAMHLRVHEPASIHSGMLMYPFEDATTVLDRCLDALSAAPDALTAQLIFLTAANGTPVVIVAPTWCGAPDEGSARVAPFLALGTLLEGRAAATSYERFLSAYDPYVVNGQRTFMETCWIPDFDHTCADICVDAMAAAPSPGCAIITHQFKGAATRVPIESTAFGLRRDHVLIEIVAAIIGEPDKLQEKRHRDWARTTRHAFDRIALPGGYPNLLDRGDLERAAVSYGPNAERLIRAKREYDPDGVFNSAIPLPVRSLEPGAASYRRRDV